MNCRNCGGEIGMDMEECPTCGQIIERDTKKVCPNCNAEIEKEARFCKKCGWNFEMEQTYQRTCHQCGSDLEENALFCPRCGKKTDGKKKVAKTKAVVVIIIILLVVAASFFGVYQWSAYKKECQRQELIVSYQQKAIELSNAIGEAESNFILLSTLFGTSTEMSTGFIGPSVYTAYAEGLCSLEINEEKRRKKDVDQLYSELELVGCNEAEVAELKKVIEDYYDAYVERYEVLVEMKFTTSDFSTKDSSSKSVFTSAKSAVRNVVDSIKIIEE